MAVRHIADPALVEYLVRYLEEDVVDSYEIRKNDITETYVKLADGSSVRHFQDGESFYYDAKGRLTCTVEY